MKSVHIWSIVEIIGNELHSNLMRHIIKKQRNKLYSLNMSSRTNNSLSQSRYTNMDVCVCGTSLIYSEIKTKLRCVLCSPK